MEKGRPRRREETGRRLLSFPWCLTRQKACFACWCSVCWFSLFLLTPFALRLNSLVALPHFESWPWLTKACVCERQAVMGSAADVLDTTPHPVKIQWEFPLGGLHFFRGVYLLPFSTLWPSIYAQALCLLGFRLTIAGLEWPLLLSKGTAKLRNGCGWRNECVQTTQCSSIGRNRIVDHPKQLIYTILNANQSLSRHKLGLYSL